jgi:pathogenesis-related protein 1
MEKPRKREAFEAIVWVTAWTLLSVGVVGVVMHYNAAGKLAAAAAALSAVKGEAETCKDSLVAAQEGHEAAKWRLMESEQRERELKRLLGLTSAAQAEVKRLAEAVNGLTALIKAAPIKAQKPAGKPQVNAPAVTEKVDPQAVAQDNASRMLIALNGVRAEYNLPTLVWSRKLMNGAGEWAQELTKSCELKHDPAWSGGENLAKGYFAPEEAVAAWAAEEKDFDLASNTCAKGKVCGHWTQIVQRDAKKVGCQQIKCSDGGPVLVCRWDVGNIVGKRPF